MVNRKAEIFDKASIFVEGVGFIASSAKGKLPDLEFVQFTNMSGFAENTTDSTILKAMKATLELVEENRVYMSALAKRGKDKATFTLKYNSNAKNVVVTLRGNVVKFNGADIETGKENKKTLEISVDFFKKEVDGVTEHLIDVDNLICEIDGTDIWENARAFHLG